MKNSKLATFTFIVDFRGGKYCTQVQAENVNDSVFAWINKIREEKAEIKYLGEKVIEDLMRESADEDYQPVLLNGLNNIWHTLYSTKQGIFSISIVKTTIK